jgi:DNA-binding XRE family transcriptional regulator
MPVSVRRHNLVRLRDALNLTQADLGKWVGRSSTTIRAIEVGKLALSPKLATLIADQTGIDAGWLLRNDLSEPMPPLKKGVELDALEKAYLGNAVLIAHLIHRLATLLMHYDRRPKQVAQVAQLSMAADLDRLKKHPEQDVKADLLGLLNLGIVEMFKAHPEMLERELRQLINLDYLSKDLLTRKQHKGESPQAGMELWKVNDEELARLMEQKRSPSPAPQALPKPRSRKSPTRTPALPSRAGRRKTEKSS